MSLSEFLNIAGAIGSIGIPFKDAAQARRLQSLHQSMEEAQQRIGDEFMKGSGFISRNYQGKPDKKKKPAKCPNCYSNSKDTFKHNEDDNIECTYCGSVLDG